ncbi:hypothetical protein BO78DRAFT_412610 [Aspergillus terreus]|uniref:Uncharacterized protein n=1 Tax=Aspergillus terreus TaxID=33178 RepID=A0A5M3ZC61_ASPTE|nr:hypothetical protein ATETN484_0014020500 [Aspergillus terreus]GFF20871.1 hypothetical protein BO78DRAFT_412610 [Aspergillus terreus]
MLKNYRSWQVYRQSFGTSSGEGNFFLAKSFQLDAAMVQSSSADTEVTISPIAKRTRAKLKERRPAPDLTPTKSARVAMERLQISDDLDDVPLTPGLEQDSPLEGSTPPLDQVSGGSEAFWETHSNTEDEQIVNTALVNFLKAIVEHFPSVTSTWTIHRKVYKARFSNTEYEARTDGYLRGKGDSDARALIEVKPCLRRTNALKIRMQESAQMVAWLNELGPSKGPPISDRHEIWLIFAEYDEKYLEYLDGKHENGDPTSFLTMHEVGPYDTQDGIHMANLAPILLALVLRADYDQQKAQGAGRSR